MPRGYSVTLGLLLACACASAPPPRKAEVFAEPKVAEDLPTWCSSEEKPCVPTKEFAKRLCRGKFSSAALYLFQKQSPWQRRWLTAKVGPSATNGEGGPTGAELVPNEEVLVMRIDESTQAPALVPKGKASKPSKPPEPEILALRWDGTCVSVNGAVAATRHPGTPKAAFVDWSKLDPFMQRSLLRDPAIERAVAARSKACSNEDAPECQKADLALSNCIVTEVRRGTKLSMPEQRP